jgi:uncharacterized protein (DUF1800 family)
MIRRHRTLFCTVLALVLHAPLAFGASVTVIDSPDDPRLPRIQAGLDAARRHGKPRPERDRAAEAALRAEDAARRAELAARSGGAPVTTGLGWTPYAGAFTLDHAAHLLHRAMIGPRFEEMTAVQAAGLASTLTTLTTPQALPPPPGAWVTEGPPDWPNLNSAQVDSLVQGYLARQETIVFWWVDRIANHQPTNLAETMVHFWHDHFATGAETVFYPQAIYGQHELLREHALGNFKELTRDLCTDPAMLIWLNGDGNTVYSPNENFARELFELFTMGEGNGYSQQDVVEAARACTGYRTDGVDTYFITNWHDNGQKTILGQTGNWDMDDLVDLIFQQPATATYLCDKLYRWFLDDEPAPEDIDLLAATLIANNWEVAPVLEQILGSAHFFDPQFRGALYKDGVDLYVGQVRALHAVGFEPLNPTTNYEKWWVQWQMWNLGHYLTNPPNVAGWPGHRQWINTASLPLRKEYSGMILYGSMWGWTLGFQVDSMAEANRFTNPNNAGALVDDVARLLLGAAPTVAVRQEMLDALLQGANPNTWSLASPGAANRVRDLLHFTMRLPDYQLK